MVKYFDYAISKNISMLKNIFLNNFFFHEISFFSCFVHYIKRFNLEEKNLIAGIYSTRAMVTRDHIEHIGESKHLVDVLFFKD